MFCTLPFGKPDWVGDEDGTKTANSILRVGCFVDVIVGCVLLLFPDLFTKLATDVFFEEPFDIDERGMLVFIGYLIMAGGFYIGMSTRMNSPWMASVGFFNRVAMMPLLTLYAVLMGYCRLSMALLLLVPWFLLSLASWMDGTTSFIGLMRTPFQTPVPLGPPAPQHTFSKLTVVMYFSTIFLMVFLPFLYTRIFTTIFFEEDYTEKGVRGLVTCGLELAAVAYAWPTLVMTQSNYMLSLFILGRLVMVPSLCFFYGCLYQGARWSVGLLFSLFDPSLCFIQWILWCWDKEDPLRQIAYAPMASQIKGAGAP